MELKAGMKVLIKDYYKIGEPRPDRWNDRGYMDKYMGKIVTIACTGLGDGSFIVKDTTPVDPSWNEWTFEEDDVARIIMTDKELEKRMSADIIAIPEIADCKVHGRATIVKFADGDIVKVVCSKDDKFDSTVAVKEAIAKKIFGKSLDGFINKSMKALAKKSVEELKKKEEAEKHAEIVKARNERRALKKLQKRAEYELKLEKMKEELRKENKRKK